MAFDLWEMGRPIDGHSELAQELGHAPRDLYRLWSASRVDDWVPLKYEVTSGPVEDVLFASSSDRIFSEPLREVLVGHLGERDVVQWLEIEVRVADGRRLPYWLMHLPIEQRVPLNRELSTIGPSGLPILWVADARAIEGRRVFEVEGVTGSIVVHDDVRREVIERGFTGIEFAKARVA